jgi:hypothetical protein
MVGHALAACIAAQPNCLTVQLDIWNVFHTLCPPTAHHLCTFVTAGWKEPSYEGDAGKIPGIKMIATAAASRRCLSWLSTTLHTFFVHPPPPLMRRERCSVGTAAGAAAERASWRVSMRVLPADAAAKVVGPAVVQTVQGVFILQ